MFFNLFYDYFIGGSSADGNFKRLPLFIFSLFSALSLPSFSQAQIDGFIYTNPDWLYLDGDFSVNTEIIDDVSDGCWTTSRDSENVVNLEFIRSGGNIVEGGESNATVFITALGFATNDYSCAVLAEIEVYVSTHTLLARDGHEIHSFHSTKLWGNGTLLTGPKSGMSKRVSDAQQRLTQEFLVELAMETRALKEEISKNLIGGKDFWNKQLKP